MLCKNKEQVVCNQPCTVPKPEHLYEGMTEPVAELTASQVRQFCVFVCLCLNLKQFKLPHSGQPSNLRGSKVSVADCEDAVRPVMSDGVKLAVQLAHGDGFGIDSCDLDLVLIHQTLV